MILAESCQHVVLALQGWETQPRACNKKHQAARSSPTAGEGVGCCQRAPGLPHQHGPGAQRQLCVLAQGQDKASPGNAFSFLQVTAEKSQIVSESVALMLGYHY